MKTHIIGITGILVAATASLCAATFETATIRIVKLDGQTAEKTAKFERNGEKYTITIPVGEITRDIKYIDIIADQATATKGERGFFVLGDSSYGTFKYDNGTYTPRYCHMPIFGMNTPRGAFAAIVRGLKYEQFPTVEANDGKYKVFPRFFISDPDCNTRAKISRTIAFDPYEDIVVDFYPLPKDATYADIAKVYRNCQLESGTVKPLRERIKGNNALAYTADSIYVRLKHARKKSDPKNPAHKMQTVENEPELEIFFTFEDFADIMRRMKAEGIDKAEMSSVGWNISGHDGRFPQYFPVEPKLGGEEKYRQVIAEGKSLGYHINCHINPFSVFAISDRYNDNGIAMYPNGKPFFDYFQPGGDAFRPCFQRFHDLWIRDDFKKMKDLGLNGIMHLDVMSFVHAYPCKDPMHPLNRKQTVEYENRVGAYAHEIFGGLASEGGLDHLAPTLDFALYLWSYPDWEGKPEKLADRHVPLWQLVYHGIILSNPYYTTIDALYPKTYATSDQRKAYDYLENPETRWLKTIEYGGRPTFYYTDYKNLKPMKRAYDEYQKLKHLQLQFMTNHRELSEKVFATTYESGEEVVVNYRNEPYTYRGETIPARGYKLLAK